MKKANIIQLVLFVVSLIGNFLMIKAILNDNFSNITLYLSLVFLFIIPWIYSLVKAIKTKDILGIVLVLLISVVGTPYVLIKKSNN